MIEVVKLTWRTKDKSSHAASLISLFTFVHIVSKLLLSLLPGNVSQANTIISYSISLTLNPEARAAAAAEKAENMSSLYLPLYEAILYLIPALAEEFGSCFLTLWMKITLLLDIKTSSSSQHQQIKPKFYTLLPMVNTAFISSVFAFPLSAIATGWYWVPRLLLGTKPTGLFLNQFHIRYLLLGFVLIGFIFVSIFICLIDLSLAACIMENINPTPINMIKKCEELLANKLFSTIWTHLGLYLITLLINLMCQNVFDMYLGYFESTIVSELCAIMWQLLCSLFALSIYSKLQRQVETQPQSQEISTKKTKHRHSN